jgi:hypothetical protein
VTSARYPLPTDLVALVSFDGRVYPNEARPVDRLGRHETGPHPLETAIEQWFSFATGKHTWVSVRGATIRGLVSARRRAKRSAWEVEVLIDADEDKGVVLSLLSRMVVGLTKLKVERVFLRLAADSSLIDVARKAGFFPYATETLLAADPRSPADAGSLSFRPQKKSDGLGVFQLYCRTVPANVRAVEGPTLREWQAVLEPWEGRSKNMVVEIDGVIAARARAMRGHPGRFAILADLPARELGSLAHAVVSYLAGSAPLLCLVPDYETSLAGTLRNAGFRSAGHYTALAKRLTKPAQELTPDTVRTAVPVR